MNPASVSSVGTIYCIGRNYAEHAVELQNAVPASMADLPIFLKPRSSRVDNGGTILIPQLFRDIHHELEVVLRMATGGKIDAFTLGIDVTARARQDELKKKGHPWLDAKGRKTFAPLGDWVTQFEQSELEELKFALQVNGMVRQNGDVKKMIFGFGALITELDARYGLMPGDLIFTGTPAGVAELKPGDQLEAWVEFRGARQTLLRCNVQSA